MVRHTREVFAIAVEEYRWPLSGRMQKALLCGDCEISIETSRTTISTMTFEHVGS